MTREQAIKGFAIEEKIESVERLISYVEERVEPFEDVPHEVCKTLFDNLQVWKDTYINELAKI